jgi:hypothetical protein
MSMKRFLASGAAKRKAMAGHALSWEACLWFLVAAILAATMGMWPPHLYL